MFNFHKLQVYKASIEFHSSVILMLKLKNSIDKIIKDQLHRSSLSIALNIAEGTGRFTKNEAAKNTPQNEVHINKFQLQFQKLCEGLKASEDVFTELDKFRLFISDVSDDLNINANEMAGLSTYFHAEYLKYVLSEVRDKFDYIYMTSRGSVYLQKGHNTVRFAYEEAGQRLPGHGAYDIQTTQYIYYVTQEVHDSIIKARGGIGESKLLSEGGMISNVSLMPEPGRCTLEFPKKDYDNQFLEDKSEIIYDDASMSLDLKPNKEGSFNIKNHLGSDISVIIHKK